MKTFSRQAARRWVAVLLVAVGMTTAAQITHDRTVIFPEAAAIALGSLALRNPRWIRTPWHIIAMPTLSAALGVLSNHLPISSIERETIIVWTVLVILTGVRSSISPAISAGVLPVVLDIHAWFFVGSVLATTGLVWIIVARNGTAHVRALHRPWWVNTGFGILSTLWILAAGASGLHDAVLPPLMVFLYESMSSQPKTVASALREVCVLTAAALTGAVGAALWSSPLEVSLAVLAISMAGMRALSTWVPPAAAIALLPLVIPMAPIGKYPLYVAVLAAGASGVGLLTQRLAMPGHRDRGASA